MKSKKNPQKTDLLGKSTREISRENLKSSLCSWQDVISQNIDQTFIVYASQSLYTYDWLGLCINLVVRVGKNVARIADAIYPS